MKVKVVNILSLQLFDAREKEISLRLPLVHFEYMRAPSIIVYLCNHGVKMLNISIDYFAFGLRGKLLT